jgi:hypothetical protein
MPPALFALSLLINKSLIAHHNPTEQAPWIRLRRSAGAAPSGGARQRVGGVQYLYPKPTVNNVSVFLIPAGTLLL